MAQLFPKTYLPQSMTNNPQGIINPKTGQPYIYASASGQSPVVPAQSSFLSSNNNSKIVTPAETPKTPTPTRSKYINPATGKYFQTAEEYGNYVATKIPAGDIPKYAGDAMMNPDASAADLTKAATNLNNARNDIAVGQTDPYKVGNQSGIAYSPTELKAIENAYAGIYDPALNDVFARLKVKEEEKAALAKREEQIFATNESIRQWKATTGSKGGGGSDTFTQNQLNDGAINAGMTIAGFSNLDEDLQNFFVQPPNDTDETTGKSYPMNKTLDNLISLVKSGDIKTKDAAEEIESSSLTESVKHYYLDQLPATDVEKEGWFSRVWGAITNK